MAEILINGKVYTVFELLPRVVAPKETLHPYGEKRRNQQNRLNMARTNYRKK